jgi:predicted DNA-binding transcriptional regulator AlpA
VREVAVPTDPDALLRETEAAALLGFKPRALQEWRRTGEGPRFVRVSGRAVRYRRRDLTEWAESRLRTSTADSSGLGRY